ncbi:UDP-glucuronate:xylan alpha-glucuronosyltransferase 5 [Populus alba x Populus x berolinensis]|nr:UDP-glucuronate:xylan alpha-glucuronosyltransferase 5 [Populus alba x Populus x berolinensis]
MASSKPQSSCQKLFITSLLFLSVSLMFLVFSFKPKPGRELDHHPQTAARDIKKPLSINTQKSWFDGLIEKKTDSEPIKIGLVNVDDHVKHAYDRMHGQVETFSVDFRPVSKELKWESFFPEWIDEDARWHQPSCPEVPMPRLDDYRDLDVILARVPCGSGSEKQGIRDVFRLQVNLVVANLVVASGLTKGGGDRTVYVVFMGSCGPMQEIFRCDDLMTRLGDYWVYKPELRRLRQKVQMPVGSCQIAPLGRLLTGSQGTQRHSMAQYSTARKPIDNILYHQRVAYATVIHSSEAYVCGAIALAQSIMQNNSTNDLVLLHDSSLSPESLGGLRAAGWKTKLIQPIRSPFARKDSYNEWNYSKLRLWQLTDYDKVVFIDADLIVLKNIDKFFAYPQLSAAPNDKVLFNSGIMVIEPSTCLFEDMMSKRNKLLSYNGGDQGFLNEAFTWWHRLPTRLNYLKIFKNQGNTDHEMQKDPYTIHFLGLKPWACYKDYDCNWDMVDRHIFASDSAHKRWWQVYDAMPKKLQKYCGLTKHMDARIRKWRGKAKNASLPDGHWKINVKDPRQYHLNY